MRVVFLQDVAGVAQGGDVKEVKNGFARNYLIPKNFAVPATHNALQRVKQYAEQAESERACASCRTCVSFPRPSTARA